MLDGEGVVVVLVVLDPDEEPEPELDGRLELELDPRLELELELDGVLEVVREPDGDVFFGDVVDCAGLLDPVGTRVLWTSETNSTLGEESVVKLVELAPPPPPVDAADDPDAVPSSTSVS